MPNWCGNYITIEGRSEDVVKCIEAMKGKRACYAETDLNTYSDEYRNKVVYTFNAHVTVPAGVLAKSYNEAGYSWQNENWGTKWDVLEEATLTLDSIVDGEKRSNNKDEIICAEFGFSSAWGPADEWLYGVSKKHPELNFKLHYEECGCQVFGTYEFGKNGYCHNRYDTEGEYIWAVDCGNDLDEAINVLLDRNDWHESYEEFIEAMQEELSFIDISDEQWATIKTAGAEMYKDMEEEVEEPLVALN